MACGRSDLCDQNPAWQAGARRWHGGLTILPHGSSWTGRELPAVPPDGTRIGGYDAAAGGDAQWDEASELRQDEPA